MDNMVTSEQILLSSINMANLAVNMPESLKLDILQKYETLASAKISSNNKVIQDNLFNFQVLMNKTLFLTLVQTRKPTELSQYTNLNNMLQLAIKDSDGNRSIRAYNKLYNELSKDIISIGGEVSKAPSPADVQTAVQTFGIEHADDIPDIDAIEDTEELIEDFDAEGIFDDFDEFDTEQELTDENIREIDEESFGDEEIGFDNINDLDDFSNEDGFDGAEEFGIDNNDEDEITLDNEEEEQGEDKKTPGEMTEEKKKEIDTALKAVSNTINQTITDINKVYTALFASGYGVIEPQGLLCDSQFGGAFLHFEQGNYRKAQYTPSTEMYKLWSIMSQTLGLKQSDSRSMKLSEIKEGKNYFPKKLLEYTFGRYTSSEEDIANDIYKKHSASKSWGSYWKEVIEKPLKEEINKMIETYITDSILSGELSMSNPIEIYDSVDTRLVEIYNAYTPCIIVSENSDGRMKIRFSDVRKVKTSTSTTFESRLNESELTSLGNVVADIIGTSEEDLSDVMTTAIRNNGWIKEIEIVRNRKLCGVVPLFAYKALEKVLEQGGKVSFDNIIVGKAEDDSIYIGNSQENNNKFKLVGNTVVHISAGSRSGKGVMTLNLLASAYASKIPVFYLDSKPDMSSLLLATAKRYGVNTFSLNGGNYDPKADMDSVMKTAEQNIVWNIPEPLRNDSNLKDMNQWGALRYIKAMDFCMWLMVAVSQGLVKAPGQNIVVVADELQKMLGSWQALYEKIHAVSKYDSELDKKSKESDKAKAAGAIIEWYYQMNKDWTSASKSSTNNILPTMFTIYQEHEVSTWNTGGLKSKTDGDTRTANTMLYRSLKSIGNSGFIGYDKNSYGASKATGGKIQPLLVSKKGKKYCNVSDRYFAWVTSMDAQDVDDAEFVKPFLILNSTENENDESSYVGEMKKQLKRSNLNDDEIEQIFSQHRLPSGELNPGIGFEGYINQMSAAMGDGYNFAEVLNSSYAILVDVLTSFGYFEASGNTNPMDYFSDFRPEFMPSWSRMNEAINGKKLSLGEQVECNIKDDGDPDFGGGIIEDSVGASETQGNAEFGGGNTSQQSNVHTMTDEEAFSAFGHSGSTQEVNSQEQKHIVVPPFTKTTTLISKGYDDEVLREYFNEHKLTQKLMSNSFNYSDRKPQISANSRGLALATITISNYVYITEKLRIGQQQIIGNAYDNINAGRNGDYSYSFLVGMIDSLKDGTLKYDRMPSQELMRTWASKYIAINQGNNETTQFGQTEQNMDPNNASSFNNQASSNREDIGSRVLRLSQQICRERNWTAEQLIEFQNTVLAKMGVK